MRLLAWVCVGVVLASSGCTSWVSTYTLRTRSCPDTRQLMELHATTIADPQERERYLGLQPDCSPLAREWTERREGHCEADLQLPARVEVVGCEEASHRAYGLLIGLGIVAAISTTGEVLGWFGRLAAVP